MVSQLDTGLGGDCCSDVRAAGCCDGCAAACCALPGAAAAGASGTPGCCSGACCCAAEAAAAAVAACCWDSPAAVSRCEEHSYRSCCGAEAWCYRFWSKVLHTHECAERARQQAHCVLSAMHVATTDCPLYCEQFPAYRRRIEGSAEETTVNCVSPETSSDDTDRHPAGLDTRSHLAAQCFHEVRGAAGPIIDVGQLSSGLVWVQARHPAAVLHYTGQRWGLGPARSPMQL